MPPESSPLEFFKTELAAENTADKIRSLRRTKVIASIIGIEETWKSLLPVLLELLGSNDDELLYTLAEELSVLSDYIDLPHLHLLIPPLEALAAQEETVVRERSVTSLTAVLGKAAEWKTAEKLTAEYLMSTAERLAKGEWFAPRVSACGLLPALYPYAKEEECATLRKLLVSLLADDTPMVQRAAAARMKDFATVVEKAVLDKTIYPLVLSAWKADSHDAVRVSALSAAIAAAERFSATENQTKVLPIIQAAAGDKSWRVRLALAKSFDRLIGPFQSDVAPLFPAFKCLLGDLEQDVRIAALMTLERFVSKLSQRDIQASDLASIFQALSEETVPTVRAAVASVIGPLAVAYGHSVADLTLLPIVLEMMRDECHDVRLNIVCHAGELCQLMGLPTVEHSLVLAVESLMSDPQWRVRVEVVNQLPYLAKQMGESSFQSTLEPLLMNAFSDVVSAVRQSAIDNIEKFGETFGAPWIDSHLLPALLDKFHGKQHSIVPSPTAGRIPGFSPQTTVEGLEVEKDQHNSVSYLTRLTVLHCVPALVRVLPSSSVENEIVQLLMNALKDPVSNVRFAAARVIKSLSTNHSISVPVLQTFVQPALARVLDEDRDVDVQHFCDQALQAVRRAVQV